MLKEDYRFHRALIDQVTPEHTPFSSREETGRLIEKWRRDALQLLTFNRITEPEYQELEADYVRLAEAYPIPAEDVPNDQCKVDIGDYPEGRLVATCRMA